MKLTVKNITIISIFTTLLFVQEQALNFLPNLQLTVFFLVLYSKTLGFKKTMIIIAIHVILDNLFMGSFNIVFVPFMFAGWLLIPIVLEIFCKKVEGNIGLALVSIPLSFFYCWLFIIPNVIVFNIEPMVYLMADIVWEIILATSSFLSILLLYNPCSKVIKKLIEY